VHAVRGPSLLRWVARVRPGLLVLLAFVFLLGLLNLLVVNQRVVLNLFYIPVVFAAWWLSRRDAVGVAMLAGLMVVAYALMMPGRLNGPTDNLLHWADLGAWCGILIVTGYMVSKLRTATEKAMHDLQQAYSGVLAILSKFIQTVDADTEAHSVRVSAWSVRIAEQLRLSAPQVEQVRVAALLHDVGKVSVSVDILRKAAALSDQERDAIREHPAHGAELVKPVGGMLAEIADAIETHHERFDGGGYRGLVGEQIPITARIIAVADAFDALLSDRPYRRGVSLWEAEKAVEEASGSHFDPRIVRALKRMIAEEGEAQLTAVIERAT